MNRTSVAQVPVLVGGLYVPGSFKPVPLRWCPSEWWKNGAGADLCDPAAGGQFDAGGGAFQHHLRAETELFGGATAGVAFHQAGAFHQPVLFHKTAEVLFMQALTGQGLHGALELEQGEGFRQHLEHHRTVLDLAPQPAHGGGEDAAVVERHVLADAGGFGFLAPVAVGLGHQAGLVEQFEPLQHQFVVPGRMAEPEGDVGAIMSFAPFVSRFRRVRPPSQFRGDGVVDQFRPAVAPVFPREIAVPVPPQGVPGAGRTGFAYQGEVNHRHHARPARQLTRVAAPVPEGVELLHIAELEIGLFLHPGPKPFRERAVMGQERAERQSLQGGIRAAHPERRLRPHQGVGVPAHHQHPRLLVGHGDDDGVQADGDVATRLRGAFHVALFSASPGIRRNGYSIPRTGADFPWGSASDRHDDTVLSMLAMPPGSGMFFFHDEIHAIARHALRGRTRHQGGAVQDPVALPRSGILHGGPQRPVGEDRRGGRVQGDLGVGPVPFHGHGGARPQRGVLDPDPRSVGVHVLVDGDTGYGNFNNVRRLVQKLGQRDIAAVCIEDKVFPKTNSFLDGDQTLADVDEFCGKIKAGKDIQSDPDFSVIARCEALIAGLGIEEALRRAEAYHAAGADGILIHSKQSTGDEILRFAREWGNRAPLVIVPTKYYGTPTRAFREAGISMVIWANHNLRASLRAMRDVTRQIYQDQNLLGVEDHVATLKDVFEISGDTEMAEAEARYLPAGRTGTSVVLLAASRGSQLAELTENRPKCMLDVRGEPLLQRLVDSCRGAGRGDITVVGGYRHEAIEVPGIRMVVNEAYADTGEIASLALATDRLEGECVISYGDILFRDYILDRLLRTEGDIVLAVDAQDFEREGLPHKRTPDLALCTRPFSNDVLDDDPAELVRIDSDLPPAEAHGEWIGLAKLSENGARLVREEIDAMRADGNFARGGLPQLLSRIAAKGTPPRVVYITGHWLDVNDAFDLAQARNFM